MLQPSFSTERLILRPRGLQDLEASIRINSDPEVMKFLGAVWPPEKQRQHLAEQIQSDQGAGLGHWAIIEKSGDDELVGWVMLARPAGHAEPELGYRLKQSAWGRGLATEAASVVLQYGWEELHLESAIALAHRDNSRSHHVLGKLGFALAGAHERGPMPELLFRRV